MSDAPPPRYAPQRAFPPYAYLPGRDPHPQRDPAGHSYGEETAAFEHMHAEDWRENEEYLYGVDLYNHGYLWEAHEAWEGIWHPSKHDELQADHLQGLIQCTAASLKIPMEQPRGLEKLAANGTARLERVARESGGHYMGLELFGFLASFRAFAGSNPTSIEARPRIELDIDIDIDIDIER